jgi:hypothetical protein
METIAYNNKRLRIICAFAASVYILFHGRPINLVKAFSSPGFYLALTVSFGISLLLVYTVHAITIWLDQISGWRKEPIKRSLLQFLLGVILPLSADLLLISIYFHAMQQNIVDNDFLLIDFPLIVFFIILMNLYYLIHYLLLTEPKPTIEYIDEIDQYNEDVENSELSGLTIDHSGQHLQFDVPQDVLCFYRVGKWVKAFTTHGNEYVVNISLSTLEERFSSVHFCMINRSVLINCKTIQGYESTNKRDIFKIIFKPPFAGIVNTSKDKNFYMTKEYLTAFRARFNT